MSARPLPDADPASAPFWEACARRSLVIQTCNSCDAPRHPPRPMCPRCNAFDHRWAPASGRARVWSWVVVHKPVLPAFADDVPYTVAVVELDEGVRMIGRLFADEVHDGMPVALDWEDAGEGQFLACWRPA